MVYARILFDKIIEVGSHEETFKYICWGIGLVIGILIGEKLC